MKDLGCSLYYGKWDLKLCLAEMGRLMRAMAMALIHSSVSAAVPLWISEITAQNQEGL